MSTNTHRYIKDLTRYQDGKPSLVQAASTTIRGSHGQYIENIHLQTYESDNHFQKLYEDEYSKLLSSASRFLDDTGGPGSDVLFFIRLAHEMLLSSYLIFGMLSCGMDACEHEYESMSRHNRKVPVSFYHRFTEDACKLSDKYANGKILSILEGGYSDRALISGAMAHTAALIAHGHPTATFDANWWCLDHLMQVILNIFTMRFLFTVHSLKILPTRNGVEEGSRTLPKNCDLLG
jgi:histone deacetylase HOS3